VSVEPAMTTCRLRAIARSSMSHTRCAGCCTVHLDIHCIRMPVKLIARVRDEQVRCGQARIGSLWDAQSTAVLLT
jgi:hypothetical protein